MPHSPAMLPLPTASDTRTELDLKDVLAQLLARVHWIVATALIGGVIGGVIGQLPPSIFRADAVVQIEQRADRIPLPEELIGDMLLGGRGESSGLTTEVHIIRSRLVLAPVIDRLGQRTLVTPIVLPVIGTLIARRDLPMIADFLPAGHARPGETVEAVIEGRPDDATLAPATLRVIDEESYALTLADGTELAGRLDTDLALPSGGKLIVTAISAAPDRAFLIRHDPMRASVARISAGLDIKERGSTGIVDFSYLGGKSGDAVRIVNAVVEEYINQNLQRRSIEIDRSIVFIEEQLRQVSLDFREANRELVTFRQQREIGELSVGTKELLDAAVELEAKLEELDYQKQGLLQSLTENHPDVRALALDENRMKTRLDQISADLSRVPEVEQGLARLTQRVERAQVLERQLSSRVEQLRILRASAVGNIRVLEPAEEARWAGPDRRWPAMAGAGAGFGLAVFLVFVLNLLRRGVEDGRDIEALGLPLFATINKAKALMGEGNESNAYSLAIHDSNDMAVEALRGLRTGLKFAMASAGSKTLMITSCAPGDGKSFVALNLAIVSGQTGARVLLVDADLRRGFLRRQFGFDKNQLGLSDMLSGTHHNCIIRSEEKSIDFLATGRFPPNPAELLEGDTFSDFLREAEEYYDLIVIDAPPALLVADPTIIGQKVGMSMLVVRHLHTSVAEIQSAKKSLETAGVRLSGAILNQFDESRSRYGKYGRRYGYYYGGYRYRYKEEKTEAS